MYEIVRREYFQFFLIPKFLVYYALGYYGLITRKSLQKILILSRIQYILFISPSSAFSFIISSSPFSAISLRSDVSVSIWTRTPSHIFTLRGYLVICLRCFDCLSYRPCHSLEYYFLG